MFFQIVHYEHLTENCLQQRCQPRLPFPRNDWHETIFIIRTAPVRVDKIDDNFSVQYLVERPYKYVGKKHEKAHYQTTDNKHVAQKNMYRKELFLHPRPHATHFRRLNNLDLTANKTQHKFSNSDVATWFTTKS